MEWSDRLKGIAFDQYIELFKSAFHKYQIGQFQEAIQDFEKCLNYFPEDNAVGNFINRCKEFLTQGIPLNWNGIYIMTSK